MLIAVTHIFMFQISISISISIYKPSHPPKPRFGATSLPVHWNGLERCNTMQQALSHYRFFIKLAMAGWPVPVGRRRLQPKELGKMLAAENNGIPNGFTETFRASVATDTSGGTDARRKTMAVCMATAQAKATSYNGTAHLAAQWVECCSFLCSHRRGLHLQDRACCNQAMLGDYFGLGIYVRRALSLSLSLSRHYDSSV